MGENRPEAPLRKLVGPGPLDVHPRVYNALTSPVIGHLDPVYLKVLDRVGELLRPVFGTTNRVTNATPGTGTSGMEACVANLMEPGDRALVCVRGCVGNVSGPGPEEPETQLAGPGTASLCCGECV